MIPSNPDNSQPLIYRIADALGVFHLVAPVNHEHAKSEITGLEAALSAKAPAEHTHISIKNGSYAIVVDPDGEVSIGCTSIVIGIEGEQEDIEILRSNVANLRRALQDPDSTPTANSDKLVKSGGVAAALSGKAPLIHTHTPLQVKGLMPDFLEFDGNEIDLDDLVTEDSGMATVIVQNKSGDNAVLKDLFVSKNDLPIHPNVNEAVTIDDSKYALCTIYKMDKDTIIGSHTDDTCYFITLDGIFSDTVA